MAYPPSKTDVPPHNLQAERGVLGLVLLDNECLDRAQKIVGQFDFYSEAHRIIFSKMLTLHEGRHAVDPITLGELLSKDGLLEKVGGPVYLSGLTDGVPFGTNGAIVEYSDIVKEHANRRKIIQDAQTMMARAMDGNVDSASLIEFAKSQFADFETEVKEPAPSKVEVLDDLKEKKRKQEGRMYPLIPADAWHPAANLYRQAHESTTEGSDNWHFASFYTAIGALLGRTVGSRMGGGRLIYPNMYTCLVGVIGGDGKDTCADEAMDFAEAIDEAIYIPEDISSKAGFCKFWTQHILRKQIADNNRCVLRLPEISSMLSVAAQKGTQSIVPMVMTNYAPRARLSNETVSSGAEILKPHFCMLACGAKVYINAIPKEDLTGGMGRRVCFIGGDVKGPKPRPAEPNSEMVNPLKAIVQSAVEFWRKSEVHSLEFSSASCRLWDNWYEKVYWKRKKGDDLIPAMNNGDRVTCLKISIINAALDKARVIEPHHLEPALAFGDFLFECRWPIFSEHGANPKLDIEKKILARIPVWPGKIGRRKLRRDCHLDGKTFNDTIHYMMMDDGEVRESKVGRQSYLSKMED